MTETTSPSFENHCVISCAILYPEINHLMETGFLNPRDIFFIAPGLHIVPERLEKNLIKRLADVREKCPDSKALAIYGKKCHVSAADPLKRIDNILQIYGQGQNIVRLQAEYGYDMLAGMDDRQRISGGKQDRILWFTPGWLKAWKTVYQRYVGWDKADANANFPGFYDKIIVLDALGLADQYMTEHAEDILELFDWTGLEVEFQPITLDRFKSLLADALQASNMQGSVQAL